MPLLKQQDHKNTLFLLIFFIAFTFSSKAQKISYGPVIGIVYYHSNNNNGTQQFLTVDNDNGLKSTINFGAYLEYQLNKRFGLKNQLTFHNKNLTYKLTTVSYTNTSPTIDFTFFDLSSNLKYDFGNGYRKGFYLLFGPRFSFMAKEPSIEENIDGTFNKLNIGLQLGIGQRFLKFIDLQAKLDYGISPFFKSTLESSHNSSFFGAYLSCNLDLERIINP